MPVFGDDGGRREKEKQARAEGRLPPGQSLTLKWPVLHNGSVPHFDPAKWDFKISGLVEEPVRLAWQQFRALPQTEVTSDFHCVTRWSRLDNRWKGVLFTDALKHAGKNPTRKSLMHALRHMDEKNNPFIYPGMTVQTSKKRTFPMEQLKIIKWSGGATGDWHPSGKIFSGLK